MTRARRGTRAPGNGGWSARLTVAAGHGRVASRNPSRGGAPPPAAPPVDHYEGQAYGSDAEHPDERPHRTAGGPALNPPLFGRGPGGHSKDEGLGPHCPAVRAEA